MKNLTYLTCMGALLCVLMLLDPASSSAKPIRGGKGMNKSKSASKSALADMKIKNVEFGFNKTEIPASSYAELDRIAKLMANNNAALKLGGYADNRGGYVYNWKLSKVRAESVKKYLSGKGADSSKIAATEYGYTKPIASNKTAYGRKKKS